ncbi:MAG TPA: pyridoxamine 5'-phosphate oxidase [Bacteroidota bacterium]|nr:pyridoxamine 5'-phosphate oxidase [Bacteroidota bacterium]
MKDELLERDADPDPIRQFKKWYDDARKAKILLPEAMTLATAGGDGKPSARMVLLKSFDQHGFIFYTNYESRKAKELTGSPAAALLFHWAQLQRQVRISGEATKVTAEESDAYFQTRPRESQISAHASTQSRVVTDRAELEKEYKRIEEKYRGKTVPRPANWGGYCVKPESIEFWKGRLGRLHDRLLYEKQSDGIWVIRRLAP